MSGPPKPPIDLADLLERLGYQEGENYQLCTQPIGGAFTARVLEYTGQPIDVPRDCDVWFGVSPVKQLERAGRPNAGDITRLAAVWIDLDIVSSSKPQGVPDWPTARAIIDDLSGLLGTRPVAATLSGHGIQPLWSLEDGYLEPAEMRAVLRRWGRLVRRIAELRGAKVDSVFDSPRVLRAPGTVNWKHLEQPVSVACLPDDGGPTTIEHLLEVLDENGITESGGDRMDPGATVSAPAEWTYADHTCRYMQGTIGRWQFDTPAARHIWLVAQATRLAAAHRNGCLTADAHQRAAQALSDRLAQLVGNTRSIVPGEVSDALAWGVQRVTAMSDKQVAEELGGHSHAPVLEAPPQERTSLLNEALRNVPTALEPQVGPERQSNSQGDADPAVGVTAPVGSQDAALAGGLPAPELPSAPAELTPFEFEVQQQALRLWVADEAKARERQRKAGQVDHSSAYLRASQIGQLPKPDPLIDGVLSRHTYAVLRGRDGTYKSFVALDWAFSLATGRRWQGLHTERVNVLYIAGEGAYGIAARMAAWEHAWGRKIEDDYFTLRTASVNLFSGGGPLDELVERIEQEKYGLVVVDTLRKASGGADGNGSDMGVVVDNFDRIKQATHNGSVLVIAHTGKDDNDTRGYSGIEDDADIIWHTKSEEGETTLNLENTKMKDGPDGHRFTLAVQPVLGSLVVQARNGDPVNADHDTDNKVLAALHAMFASTGATVAELVEVTAMPRSTIYHVRGRLESAGLITLAAKGGGHSIKLTSEGARQALGIALESDPRFQGGFQTPSGGVQHAV